MYKKLKRFLQMLGPGFITGASDDDPSGITTYSQAGAQFGLSQLWTALFSLPFMVVMQEMCGRIGMVTGCGLAGVMRKHYGKKVVYGAVGLLLIGNTITIGADLGAMAAAAQLLVPAPFIVLLLLLTAGILLLEIFVSYRLYATFLKYLALSLFAYVVSAFLVHPHWGSVVRATFVPHIALTKEYLLNIVAILGTTISPYLFFWQANEEVEEEIVQHKIIGMGDGVPRISAPDLKRMRWDTIIGMAFSNAIMFFIIVTAASTLGVHGITQIETASQAAEALRPLAGNLTFLFFTAGIIGIGLLAVPVLAGSVSYAVSEALDWKSGLSRKLSAAHGFYGVITIAMLVGLLVNFTHIPPFRMLYYAAALNGLIAPPLMFLIMRMANNKASMGGYVNSRTVNVLGWCITAVMAVCGLTFLVSLF